MAAKRSWMGLAWLSLILPAGIISYGGILLAQPCCEEVAWYSVLWPPHPALGVVILIGLAFAALGIGGALGLLPRTLVRGAKVRWALWLAGLPWSLILAAGVLFTLNQSRPGTNPIFRTDVGEIPRLVLVAGGGFIVTASVVWLVLFVADALRHALGPAPRGA